MQEQEQVLSVDPILIILVGRQNSDDLACVYSTVIYSNSVRDFTARVWVDSKFLIALSRSRSGNIRAAVRSAQVLQVGETSHADNAIIAPCLPDEVNFRSTPLRCDDTFFWI